MQRFFGRTLATLAAALVIGVPNASATLYTLTDTNSTAVVNTDPTAGIVGMNSWDIDGISILYQQWFWYRVGNTGPEHSLDSLTLVSATQTNSNRGLSLLYNNSTSVAGPTFSIQIDYLLTGGGPSSFVADIAETITIKNLGTSSLGMHFFQYSDFDMIPGNPSVDTVQIDTNKPPAGRGSALATQYGSGGVITESLSGTTAQPVPTRSEVNFFSNTANALNDGATTNLATLTPAGSNTTSIGPGDVTWAFQWDQNIGAGGTFQISKDKQYSATVVPEPATLLLLGGCLLVVGRKLNSRISAK